MVSFAQAIKISEAKNVPVSYTENGAKTFARSGSSNVDLFFLIGSGSKDPSFDKNLLTLFEKAYLDNKELATRILLWSRDVRGGAGRRKAFRDILKFMEKNYEDDLIQILPYIWNYGRWDDYLIFTNPKVKTVAYDIIWTALADKDKVGLIAKWLPREKSAKRSVALDLAKHMRLTPRSYRKMLSGLTHVVENKMCARQWDDIDFSKIPSKAASNYAKAFAKRAPVSYNKYLESLKNGDTNVKVNASAIFPHDVTKNLVNGNAKLAIEQWKALPNYLGDKSVIPLCDVSGSMGSMVQGNTRAIDISVALGLYCADKNTGAFKDVILTFESKPKIQVVKGDLAAKYRAIESCLHMGSTDLNAAFKAILKMGVEQRIPQKEMPKYVLIISDMEFNSCCHLTNYQAIKKEYQDSGYVIPRIVFWNVMGRVGNSPVTFDTNGTALVSGYSPSILKNIFNVETFTPENVMFNTVMGPRYNIWN